MTETFLFSALMAVLLIGVAVGAVIVAKWFDNGDKDD